MGLRARRHVEPQLEVRGHLGQVLDQPPQVLPGPGVRVVEEERIHPHGQARRGPTGKRRWTKGAGPGRK